MDASPKPALPYRVAYSVGSRWGLFGILFVALGLVFALLPTNGVTLDLSGLCFVFAFVFFIVTDCCCGGVSHSVVHEHGDVCGLLPYLPPTLFGTYSVVRHV